METKTYTLAQQVHGLQTIAHLIGMIFLAGDFKAETEVERELEALLIGHGYRYRSWDEANARAGEITWGTSPAPPKSQKLATVPRDPLDPQYGDVYSSSPYEKAAPAEWVPVLHGSVKAQLVKSANPMAPPRVLLLGGHMHGEACYAHPGSLLHCPATDGVGLRYEIMALYKMLDATTARTVYVGFPARSPVQAAELMKTARVLIDDHARLHGRTHNLVSVGAAKKHDGPCWRNSHADCGC